jgi:hypothetical protein
MQRRLLEKLAIVEGAGVIQTRKVVGFDERAEVGRLQPVVEGSLGRVVEGFLQERGDGWQEREDGSAWIDAGSGMVRKR